MNQANSSSIQTLSAEELELIAGGGDLGSFRENNIRMAIKNGLTLTDLISAA